MTVSLPAPKLGRYPIGAMLALWVVLIVGLTLIWPAALAEEGRRVFTAGVSQDVLPAGMYGQWSVEATLIETDYPPWFPPGSNDFWVLQQIDRQVQLSNPATGASAMVKVEQTTDDSAQFRYIYSGKRLTVIERPNIQVKGDQLLGETTIERIVEGFNGVSVMHRGRYRIQAQRLGNGTLARVNLKSLPDEQVATGRIRGVTPPPNFQILPVIKGTDKTRPFQEKVTP